MKKSKRDQAIEDWIIVHQPCGLERVEIQGDSGRILIYLNCRPCKEAVLVDEVTPWLQWSGEEKM